MESSERVTVPEHLSESLKLLLLMPCVKFLPDDLKNDLRSALDEADKTEAARWAAVQRAQESNEVECAEQDEDEKNDKQKPDTEELEPPTIAYDLLRRLSQWARKNDSMGCIKRASVDPSQYTMVAMLAGTQVYYPSKHRERLALASSNTQSSFLPAYLNPPAPTLVQEYRSFAKDLSTALNVLFSTIGAGFAVFLAAKGGAGYKVDVAALLGIGAAVVVCVAEMGLLWIVGQRREEERRKDREEVAKVMRGSGAIEVAADAGTAEQGDPPGVAMDSVVVTGETSTITTSIEKRAVRLRRRELPSKPTP